MQEEMKVISKPLPEKSTKLVAIDDDELTLLALRRVLKDFEYPVFSTTKAVEGLSHINEDTAVVFLDLNMPDLSGWDCLSFIRKEFPHVQVIILTGSTEVSDAVEAMRQGAFQYMTKPFTAQHVGVYVEKAVQAWKTLHDFGDLLESHCQNIPVHVAGDGSDYSDRLLLQVEKIAQLDSTVFIGGESGTGKSTVARLIHQSSARAKGPFVTVNCASLPRDLIQSELFGHAKGSFTGAIKDRVGHAEVANGGTLFLDEIGDLPLELQPKLLTFLQDKTIQRLGTSEPRKVDVRLIVATHRDLARMCREHQFREDLYYRLMVLGIELLPLRERIYELPVLSERILASLCRRMEKSDKTIRADAMAHLQSHDWPGNIRELENLLERALAFSASDELTPDDFVFSKITLDRRTSASSPSLETCSPKPSSSANISKAEPTTGFPNDWLGKTLKEIEREAIIAALQAHRGNKAKTARTLGISEKSIYNKMHRLKICEN